MFGNWQFFNLGVREILICNRMENGHKVVVGSNRSQPLIYEEGDWRIGWWKLRVGDGVTY